MTDVKEVLDSLRACSNEGGRCNDCLANGKSNCMAMLEKEAIRAIKQLQDELKEKDWRLKALQSELKDKSRQIDFLLGHDRVTE